MAAPVVLATGGWSADLFVWANLLALALLYAWGVHRARRNGWSWPTGRILAAACGIALLGVAYVSPLETLSHTYFWAHMGAHLIVMMLAAPAIVLSSPVRLLVYATSGAVRRGIVRALRSPIALLLVNPVLTWLLFFVTLVGLHVTPVMEWILGDHDAMMIVERPLYLVAALLFYYPLVGNDLCPRRPRPAIRLASLGLMMIPETALGMVIFFAPVVLYPSYAASAAALGHAALDDQKLAGALMWALAMVIDSVWMMVAALEWWRAEERITRQWDRSQEGALP